MRTRRTANRLSGVTSCARVREVPSALYTCYGSECLYLHWESAGGPYTCLYLVSKYTCNVNGVSILVLGVALEVLNLMASVSTV